MTQTTDLEFVNDWTELEEAVTWLNESASEDTPLTNQQAVDTIVKYVPRLLTQYANLVELSFALTEGWEQYASLQKPSGLYLPDNR